MKRSDKEKIDWSMAPKEWRLCFMEGCDRKEECLRFLAGKRDVEMTWGPAVYPSARNGEGCKLFAPIRTVTKARGFDNLFSEVKKKDAAAMRLETEQYLGGHGSYYRYMHGERLLDEEQQKWIRNLFVRHGYSHEIRFREYVTQIDFPKF